MGCRGGRLRPGRWMFCRQLCGGWRGLAGRSGRPSYSGLPAIARCDLAGASRPARSNGQKRHFHLRLRGRLRLFQASFVAGCAQIAIVLATTPLVLLFAQYRDDNTIASGRAPALSVISLLPLIYVVLAAGIALTKHRYVTFTSVRIRYASRLASP